MGVGSVSPPGFGSGSVPPPVPEALSLTFSSFSAFITVKLTEYSELSFEAVAVCLPLA